MKSFQLLFIIDPIHTLDFKNDASFLMMAEAKRRKHRVFITTVDQMHIAGTSMKSAATVSEITTIWGVKKKWKLAASKTVLLETFPIILMRKDPPFTVDYVVSTYLLSLVDRKKTFIFNEPAALRNFNEKIGIFHFKKFVPPSIVSKRSSDISDFLRIHHTIVLKPLDRSSGQEVLILKEDDKNRNSLLEILTHKQTRYIMAQKYLPQVTNGDVRIFILDGKILGSYNRIAHASDYRSNLHSGGVSKPYMPSARERKVASRIATQLKKMGIYFAGLDMIGGYVTEINVTSPGGGFDLLAKTSKKDPAKEVIDFCEKMAKKSHKSA